MSATIGQSPFAPRDDDLAAEVEAEMERQRAANEDDSPNDPDDLADLIRRQSGWRL